MVLVLERRSSAKRGAVSLERAGIFGRVLGVLVWLGRVLPSTLPAVGAGRAGEREVRRGWVGRWVTAMGYGDGFPSDER